MNINNEKKILNMNDINLNMNEIYFNNINSNNNYNDSNMNSTNTNTLKSKKINSMLCSMDNETFNNKNKGEIIYPQITPKKSINKKTIDLFLKNKNNYSIDSYHNIENKEEKNSNIKNHATINVDKKCQHILPKKYIIKTEGNSKLNSKKIMQKSKAIIKKAKIKQVNNNKVNLNNKIIKNITNAIKPTNDTNETNNNNNVNNNQNSKKYESIKDKNYYGFDERHNLEGIINNHSYHISIYSRKKVNPKNTCIETIK